MSLSVRDLVRGFGPRLALDGVSLDVGRGELHGFVGVNGAGKSTTMRIIAGLVTAQGGTVEWCGSPVSETERRRFALMPEQRGLYPRMRVGEQLEHFARLRGLRRADAAGATARWLDRLEVGHATGRQAQELSHGNQQRVQLAACLVGNPELLLLDEPFSGLDIVGVRLVSEILAELAAAGTAILLSSHQLDIVQRVCSTLTIIDRGRTVISSDPTLAGGSRPRIVEADVDAPREWVDELWGASELSHDGTTVRLVLDERTDPHQVLEVAARHGRVRSFRQREPDLEELLMMVLAADDAGARAPEVVA